jgi:hypothetical protein
MRDIAQSSSLRKRRFAIGAVTLVAVTLAAEPTRAEPTPAVDSDQKSLHANTPRHAFQLTLDLAFRSVRDDLLVPWAFSGPEFALVPRYLGTLGPGLLDTQLRFGAAPVFNRFGHNGFALTYGLRAGYFFVVDERSTGWAVGPALGWDYEMFYLSSWDDAHGYWLGTRWLGPGLRTWTRLSSGYRLAFSADLSLLGFESRPPSYRYNKQDAMTHPGWYLSEPLKRAEFGWLPDFQVLRLAAEIHRAGFRAPSGWGLGTELTFTHAAEPASAWDFQLGVQLSHAWGF